MTLAGMSKGNPTPHGPPSAVLVTLTLEQLADESDSTGTFWTAKETHTALYLWDSSSGDKKVPGSYSDPLASTQVERQILKQDTKTVRGDFQYICKGPSNCSLQ